MKYHITLCLPNFPDYKKKSAPSPFGQTNVYHPDILTNSLKLTEHHLEIFKTAHLNREFYQYTVYSIIFAMILYSKLHKLCNTRKNPSPWKLVHVYGIRNLI